MTLSVYTASVPVLTQMLTALSDVLKKAEAHAAEKNIEPDALLQARLFPDMLPFTRQVLIAADFAKGACARLAGADVPKYEDTEQSFADLKARIARTIAFIEGFAPAQIDGSEDRDITTSAGPNSKTFKGQAYLLNYALPQFFFHVTTAYALLRHNGVEIGKKNYMGKY
jgi:hypothetical protein